MEQNSFLTKVNKHFTKKRVSIMNHKDALIAEEQESNRGTTTTEAAEEAALVAVTGGNSKESIWLSFFDVKEIMPFIFICSVAKYL